MKTKQSRWQLYAATILLLAAFLLNACSDNTSYSANANNDRIAGSAITNEAVRMEEMLYGERANTYDVSDTLFWNAAIRYWAKTCGLTDSNMTQDILLTELSTCPNGNAAGRSLVDPGTVKNCIPTQYGLETCDVDKPGNLQCVQFVKGVFATLGNRFELPVTGNAIDFWNLYSQRNDGWTEVSTEQVTANKGAPKQGDMIVFADSDPGNPFGHIGIVVGINPPLGNQDGSILVAGSNQTTNASAADLVSLSAPRGNFYRVTWHSQDYLKNHTDAQTLEAWSTATIKGFIRNTFYYSVTGTNANTDTSPGLTGTFPTACTSLTQAPTDPYQDPILKAFLAQADYQSADIHNYVNMAWCVAIRFGLPPQYYILQMAAESNFDPMNTWIHAYGIIQLTSDDLKLSGDDGQSGSIPTPNCVFDMTAAADCMNPEANQPEVTTDNLKGRDHVLYNMEVGARVMLDKLIYNLAPVGQQIDEITPQYQTSGKAAVPFNTKVQKCIVANYSFAQNPDCLEGLARAMVDYNGGQDVVSGNNTGNINGPCASYYMADPQQPGSWLSCLWKSQDTRDPHNSNDGNHPNNGDGVHEAARYIINIFDYLPHHQTHCEGDNVSDVVQQTCLNDIANYPNFL